MATKKKKQNQNYYLNYEPKTSAWKENIENVYIIRILCKSINFWNAREAKHDIVTLRLKQMHDLDLLPQSEECFSSADWRGNSEINSARFITDKQNLPNNREDSMRRKTLFFGNNFPRRRLQINVSLVTVEKSGFNRFYWRGSSFFSCSKNHSIVQDSSARKKWIMLNNFLTISIILSRRMWNVLWKNYLSLR